MELYNDILAAPPEPMKALGEKYPDTFKVSVANGGVVPNM